ncbi:MAG: hypothetical protein WCR07_16005 [Verrucomicrobiota bacterium]|jgi:plastocyanin
MKAHRHILPHTLAALAALALDARADIIVPGANGSDGVLNITENTVIDLSLAATGVWNTNTAASSPNFGRGTYDPAKWAVVFKYSSISISQGATVTFKNHPSRAPVVWLVSGNAVIDGTVNLNGEEWKIAPLHAEPGPGGFRGGQGNYGPNVNSAAGFGVGGGGMGVRGNYAGIQAIIPAYGNPSNLQLIGGSGGGGSGWVNPDKNGGGAGGGAILVASAKTIQVNGGIVADGGAGRGRNYLYDANQSGAGSGGAIRLIADIIQGRGLVRASGGESEGATGPGGTGRIRVERVTHIDLNPGVIAFSPDPSVVTLQAGDTALLWPRSEDPKVRITGVGNKPLTSDPRAGFGAFGPDVALALTNRVYVTVETQNVEPESQVIVRLTPRANGSFVEATATLLTSTNNARQWIAQLQVAPGYSAVQARVIRP